MKKRELITVITLAVLAVTVLLGTALSSRVFYTTLEIQKGEMVHDEGSGSYELPFYLYKDAWSEYQANVVDLTIDIDATDGDLAQFTFELRPKHNYQLDSLQLGFYFQDIPRALLLKNPHTGEEVEHEYTRIEGGTYVRLEFDPLETVAGEKVTIDMWLDLSEITSSVSDGLLLTSFSMHQDSVFKIARHVSREEVLNINIPAFEG